MIANQTRRDLGWPLLLVAVTICVIAGHGTVALGDWTEETELAPADGEEHDYFGHSVSVCNDTAVVGAYDDDCNGESSGSAYVFRSDGRGWVEETKLLPSDGAVWDAFGWSVSIWGDTAVIGAPGDADNGEASGSAYVFRYHDATGWVEEAKLLPSDGAEGDWFGQSVSICNDTAVIAAPCDQDNGEHSGSAYVFRYYFGGGWVEEAKLLPSDGAVWDSFGLSVSIWGDTAVIGAFGDDDNGNASGSAYVFRCDGRGWVEEAKLLPFDGAGGDRFGISVSICGGIAVVGAAQDDDNGSSSGSAYVFRNDGADWVEEAKLLASDGETEDEFGCSVSICGDTAVIGAPSSTHEADSDDWCGSAYVFRNDGADWVEVAKLLPSFSEEEDQFGYSVSVSGDIAVIGAYRKDWYGTDSGLAYVFEKVQCPADFDGDGDVDTADLLFLLGAWGTPDGDVDGDGDTDTADLLALLGAWGPY